jgi:hypothetical protein
VRILLYVGSAFLAGLLALELGLWLRGRPIAQLDWQRGLLVPDPERGWAGRPGAARWVENGSHDVFVANGEDGNRLAGSSERPLATHHILVLGGSTAWGKGVGQGAVLSDWLRRDLPGDVAVRNRAVPGYALEQTRQTLTRALETRRFDEVLLLLSPGDLHDGDAWRGRAAGAFPASDGLRTWVEEKSRAARSLGRQWDRLSRGRPAPGASESSDADARAQLSAMAELVRPHGARLVLIYAASEAEVAGEKAGGSALRRWLAAGGAASGAAFYDATGALRASGPPAEGLELFDSRLGTWTQRAHFLAAHGLIGSGVLRATDPAFSPDDAVRIGPRHPFVQYAGRVETPSEEEVRFDWPGVAVRVRIEADACRFLLRAGGSQAYFNVTVDGTRTFVFRAGPEGRALEIRQLGPGSHEIEVQKRYQSSPVSFFGLELPPEGRILEPPPLLERRIEVLGASVAAGLGSEGFLYGYRNLGARRRRCADKWRLTDAGSSYGAYLADRFGAEVRFTTREGVGVMRNYADPKTRSEKPYPVYFARTLSSRAGEWRGAWEPGLVLLNLGENDYGGELPLDEAAFRTEYVAFLELLRDRYPGAYVIAFADEEKPRLLEQIRVALAERGEAGDRRLELVSYPETQRSEKGCSSHPTAGKHRALARLLAPRVEEALGWSLAGAPPEGRSP